MKAYERVYTALSGGIPDRVPYVPKIWVDLAAAMAGIPLTEVVEQPSTALRILAEAALSVGADGVRQFHFPERRTLTADGNTAGGTDADGTVYEIDRHGRRLGKIDMLGGLGTRLERSEDYRLEDPYTMAHYHYWSSPESAIRTIADVQRIAVPDAAFYREIGWEARQRKVMDMVGDRIAVIGDCNSATLAFYECLRGMDRALFDLIDDPALVHAVMDKGVAMAIEKGKFHIGMGIRILRLNDSVANMSVISPTHWREFIKPRIRTVCAELHRIEPGVRIYCHICGNVLPILNDLVETGLDCIAPLDPLGGFSCAQAREKVGDRVSLMGGINTLSFIDSTEEQLEAEAEACIRGAGQRGAFILGSGCVVPRSAKRENLVAAAKAAVRYGTYTDGTLADVGGALR